MMSPMSVAKPTCIAVRTMAMCTMDKVSSSRLSRTNVLQAGHVTSAERTCFYFAIKKSDSSVMSAEYGNRKPNAAF
jgi:hypothetical protein